MDKDDAREAAEADWRQQLNAAQQEIARLRELLEEGEAAVRSIVAENAEYAARNEALQAQQTILTLEGMFEPMLIFACR